MDSAERTATSETMTEIDLWVLEYVASREGWLPAHLRGVRGHLDMLGVDPREAHRSLAALRRGGLLRARQLYANLPDYHWLTTEEGRALLERPIKTITVPEPVPSGRKESVLSRYLNSS